MYSVSENFIKARSHQKEKELISGLLHLLGFGLSVAALIILIVVATKTDSSRKIISVIIFGLSLIFVYLASTIYHLFLLKPKTKNILKRIDHSMIFILIAGTYTPVCLIALRGGWGWSFFGIAWGLALIGVIIKGIDLKISGWLSTIIYIMMGWMIVIAIWPLINSLSLAGLLWLAAGGIIYTLGTIFYGLDRIIPKKRPFWMHEIWHLFVMAGSFAHFWMILKYVLPIN